MSDSETSISASDAYEVDVLVYFAVTESFGKHVEQNIKQAFLDRVEDYSDKSKTPIIEFLKNYLSHIRTKTFYKHLWLRFNRELPTLIDVHQVKPDLSCLLLDSFYSYRVGRLTDDSLLMALAVAGDMVNKFLVCRMVEKAVASQEEVTDFLTKCSERSFSNQIREIEKTAETFLKEDHIVNMIDSVDTRQLPEPIESIRKNLKHKSDSLGNLNKASASGREYVVKAQSAAALKSNRQRNAQNINEMSRVLQSRLRMVREENRDGSQAERRTNPEGDHNRFVALVNRLRDSNQQESLRELLRRAEMVEAQLSSDNSETAVVSPVESSPVLSLLDSAKHSKNSSVSSSLETLASNETDDQNKPDPFFLPRENDIELDRSIIFHKAAEAFSQSVAVSIPNSQNPEKKLDSQNSSRRKQVSSVPTDDSVSKVSTPDLDERQSNKLPTISSFIKRSNDKEIGCSNSLSEKSKDLSQNIAASISDSEEPGEKSRSSRRKQVFSVRVDDSASKVYTYDYDKKHSNELPSLSSFRKRSYPASPPSTPSQQSERRVELNQFPYLWQIATAGTAFAYEHESEVAETSSVQRLHIDDKTATSGTSMGQQESISSQSRQVSTTGSDYQFSIQKQASRANRPEAFRPDENENKVAVIKSKADEAHSREMLSRSSRATSSRADIKSNSTDPNRLQSEQGELSNLDVSEIQANVNEEVYKKLEGTFFKRI